MNYKTDLHNGVLKVKISDVLTFDDHENFKSVVKEIEADTCSSVEINVYELTAIDSAGVGLLLLANDRAKKKNKVLTVTGLSGHVKKVAELFKLNQLVKVA